MYSLKITSYASTAANPNRYRRFDYDYFVAVVDFVVVDFVEAADSDAVDSVETAVGNFVEVAVDDIDFDSAAGNYSAGIDRKAVENFRESYCCRDNYFAALCSVR